MTQAISRWILFRLLGWRAETTITPPPKCILCVAPHTSNMDFLLGKLYYAAIGRQALFLMKKEWFFWPLGPILRAIGGIPVYRSEQHSLTDALAEQAQGTDRFELAVTPEGTRSKRTTWKKGFFYIAQKADIPILLYGLDYAQRRIVCTQQLDPNTLTADEAITQAKEYFKQFTGKHPEKFGY